jgi:hypothetical protein
VLYQESGWSNSDIFKSYLQDHFLPFVGGGGTTDPILLIFDGHASQSLIQWAKDKHLILFVLPAVFGFGPFKTYYYQECAAFMQNYMGQSITRYDMTELACRAYLKAMTPANIQAAFKKTGILSLERTIFSQGRKACRKVGSH